MALSRSVINFRVSANDFLTIEITGDLLSRPRIFLKDK